MERERDGSVCSSAGSMQPLSVLLPSGNVGEGRCKDGI